MIRVVCSLLVTLLMSGYVSCLTPCLTWNVIDGKLILICRAIDFSTTVTMHDNKGRIIVSCDFKQDCYTYIDGAKTSFNRYNRTVTLIIENFDKESMHGVWTCGIGCNRYTTQVSEIKEMASSTKLFIVGKIVGKQSINITCSSCREPHGMWTEFLINNKSEDTIVYNHKTKQCFNKDNNCTNDVCACLPQENTFSRIFTIGESSKRYTFSCYMKFVEEIGEQGIIFVKSASVILVGNALLQNERTTKTSILNQWTTETVKKKNKTQVLTTPEHIDVSEKATPAWQKWLLWSSVAFFVVIAGSIFCIYFRRHRNLDRNTVMAPSESIPLLTTVTLFEDHSIEITIPKLIRRSGSVLLNTEIKPRPDTFVKEVKWYRATQNITTKESRKYKGSTAKSPSLEILEVSESDNGLYQCIVEFSDGSSISKETSLIVPKVIYCQDMFVVHYFQPTKQLHQIQTAFEDRDKRIVILQGISGSGKSQTAHEYCKAVRNKYSIVAKISLSKSLTFFESLEKFMELIQYRVEPDQEVTSEVLTRNLKDFFNLEERYGFPYLLFVDNVDIGVIQNSRNILHLVSLTEEVPNLYFILATTNQNFATNFSDEQYELVHFDGMAADEYQGLFQNFDFKSPKENTMLVKVVGSIPLVLATTVRYMKTTKKEPRGYCQEYSSQRFPMLQAIATIFDDGCNKAVLQSQRIPLLYAKDLLSKEEGSKIWEVVKMIPLFRFKSVSTTVLEACYYHHTKCSWEDKKKAISDLVEHFSKVSLCQIESINSPRIRIAVDENSSLDIERKIVMERANTLLSFHEVTIHAIDTIEEPNVIENKANKLLFLLRMFCYEIDIDARTDETVARNLQFVRHAQKLLLELGEFDRVRQAPPKSKSEFRFYLAYLHCAIGSTLLFERTNVEKAHKHLMIARRFVLSIVSDKSSFTKDACTFLSADASKSRRLTQAISIEDIKRVLGDIQKVTFEPAFVKDFVLGKHRNQNDVDVIRKELDIDLNLYDSFYLSENDYELLLDKKLALSLDFVMQTLLSELMLRTLHNNGRALNELTYIIEEHKHEHKFLREACIVEFTTSMAICDLMKQNINDHFGNISLFVCLTSDRSGRMIRRFCKEDIDMETLDDDIKYFKSLITNDSVHFFDFGILKMTNNSNIRHTSLCHRILLRYHLRKYKTELKDEKRCAIYKECRKEFNILRSQLKEMESSNIKYTWLSLPLLYIQCGKFLQLSENEDDIVEALMCFEHALNIERSRQAGWTRFVFEGYLGKVKCLQLQGKKDESSKVIKDVIDILKGKNRDHVMAKFKDM